MVIGIGNNYCIEGKDKIKKFFEKKGYTVINCDEFINDINE